MRTGVLADAFHKTENRLLSFLFLLTRKSRSQVKYSEYVWKRLAHLFVRFSSACF